MTQNLYDFISSVRMADSIEQEKFVIATEMAQIRATIRKCDPDLRPLIVSKLMFLDMLGENPTWGQIEIINLMSDERFSYKRIGYIAAQILLDESGELSVLVTQTLLKDLTNPDPYINCLALTYIANLGSQEVCRSVSTEVSKLLKSSNPDVQKRAGMAMVRVCKKNPELCETFKNSVQALLNQGSHGIVISGMNLVVEMIKVEPKLAKSWSQFYIPFTKILKSLVNSRPTREYMSGIYNDPFMQIKAMQAIALLRKRSDELEGILQSIISSTESRRNTGRAILYQAVETIVAISKKSSLRGLAFNQVGRLLSLHDPNILYSALSVFARILYNEKMVISRGSADSMALQRYKTQIVNCLDHKDPSVRRRALDVISALIDEKNVETLIPEILGFVKLADSDFRSELIAKIYTATQRFAPTVEWNFNTVHQILIDSGNYVSAELISSFCELITKTPNLQQHAVTKLSDSLLHFTDNQSLIQVAAFVIGEFSLQDKNNEKRDALIQILKLPQTQPETMLYIMMAIAKMAARFGGDKSVTINILTEFSHSNALEVQQRAGELAKLLSLGSVAETLLAPIAAIGDTDIDERSIAIEDNPASQKDEIDLLDLLSSPSNSNQSAPPPNPMDLLGLAQPAPQQTKPQIPINQPQQNLNLIPQTQQIPAAVQPKPQQPSGAFEIAQLHDVSLFGQSIVNQKDPRQTALQIICTSKAQKDLANIQIALNPGPNWQVKSMPPNLTNLKPGNQPILQTFYLFNPTGAPVNIQVKVTYFFGTMPVTENCVIRKLQ